MSEVRLREIRESDLGALADRHNPDDDPWNYFGFEAENGLRRRFEADGLLSADLATLAIVDAAGTLLGAVSWHATHYGPSSMSRVLNIGISVLPEYRGRGYGAAAQRELAAYLFSTTLLERVEASTDIENIAEQRSLEKAGFTREGVLRHAQYRAGRWHDLVVYSRLRGDQ